MKKLICALMLSALTLPALASSVKATVNGMVCAFCAQGIEKRVSGMSATKAVFVDLKNKTVLVEPKEGQSIDQKALSAEIAEAGYEVVKLETINKSVDEFKADLKKSK